MYVDTRTQTWPCSPGINVATHKNQSCCLSWCSCFAECGSKSTLMSGGAGGCAQGPVRCRCLCICLRIACGSQSSTSHACCRTARASLHLLKRSFGWPIFGAVGLHVFCLPSLRTLHVKPASWHQTQENMNEKQPVAAKRVFYRRQKKRIYHGRKIGATNLEAGLLIFVLWPQFWVQNLAPVLGPQSANRNYSIRAANVLLPLQADSSTYP